MNCNFFVSEVSVGTSSWDAGSDGRGSLSPASSITATSASETDVEASSTIGVTQTTPYQCSFCDKAFPRLSYLKRHEQVRISAKKFLYKLISNKYQNLLIRYD